MKIITLFKIRMAIVDAIIVAAFPCMVIIATLRSSISYNMCKIRSRRLSCYDQVTNFGSIAYST